MDRLKRFLSASLCTILLSYFILAIAIRNVSLVVVISSPSAP